MAGPPRTFRTDRVPAPVVVNEFDVGADRGKWRRGRRTGSSIAAPTAAK